MVAVTVRLTGPEDEAAGLSFRGGWEQWHQNVPLMTVRSARCSIAAAIVKYLCRIRQEDRYHRLVVLTWRCDAAAAAPR